MTDDEITYAAIRYVQTGGQGELPCGLEVLPEMERQRVLDRARRYVAAATSATADDAVVALVDRLAAVYERQAWQA